jgi:hypothetical protein
MLLARFPIRLPISRRLRRRPVRLRTRARATFRRHGVRRIAALMTKITPRPCGGAARAGADRSPLYRVKPSAKAPRAVAALAASAPSVVPSVFGRRPSACGPDLRCSSRCRRACSSRRNPASPGDRTLIRARNGARPSRSLRLPPPSDTSPAVPTLSIVFPACVRGGRHRAGEWPDAAPGVHRPRRSLARRRVGAPTVQIGRDSGVALSGRADLRARRPLHWSGHSNGRWHRSIVPRDRTLESVVADGGQAAVEARRGNGRSA